MIHTVKGFGIVNKAEIDVSLELSCFFNVTLHQKTPLGKMGNSSFKVRNFPLLVVHGSHIESYSLCSYDSKDVIFVANEKLSMVREF